MKNFMILRFDEISYRFLIGISFGEKKITPVVDKILGLKNWGTRIQSCSVSKETIDLTVTEGRFGTKNSFKSANIIILCQTKASLW